MTSTLIQVGCLTMTPEQFERALREDMTVSQAKAMIEREALSPSPSPLMGDVQNDPAVSTRDAEDSER